MLKRPRLDDILYFQIEAEVREGNIPELLPREQIDAALKRAKEFLYENKKGEIKGYKNNQNNYKQKSKR